MCVCMNMRTCRKVHVSILYTKCGVCSVHVVYVCLFLCVWCMQVKKTAAATIVAAAATAVAAAAAYADRILK